MFKVNTYIHTHTVNLHIMVKYKTTAEKDGSREMELYYCTLYILPCT